MKPHTRSASSRPNALIPSSVSASRTRRPQTIQSQPQAELLFQIKAAGLPQPETEYRFLHSRGFRFDIAWPWIVAPLGVEVDGGIWSGGRHTRGVGYTRDCEKLALAMIHGWRVIKCTPAQVRTGQAIGWITELLA